MFSWYKYLIVIKFSFYPPRLRGNLFLIAPFPDRCVLVPFEYAAPIWHPYNETQTAKVDMVQGTASRWTCRRWRNSSSVGDMLDELQWPSLESRRERSSLTFFYNIHSGTLSLDKKVQVGKDQE